MQHICFICHYNIPGIQKEFKANQILQKQNAVLKLLKDYQQYTCLFLFARSTPAIVSIITGIKY